MTFPSLLRLLPEPGRRILLQKRRRHQLAVNPAHDQQQESADHKIDQSTSEGTLVRLLKPSHQRAVHREEAAGHERNQIIKNI